MLFIGKEPTGRSNSDLLSLFRCMYRLQLAVVTSRVGRSFVCFQTAKNQITRLSFLKETKIPPGAEFCFRDLVQICAYFLNIVVTSSCISAENHEPMTYNATSIVMHL